MLRKPFSLCGYLLLETALAGLSAFQEPVLAQDGVGIEEITVTARRREESLQRVPVAVTAIGLRQLENAQAADLKDIQSLVPNLNLVQGRGSSSSANIFIRGIGQPDALQTFDPGVGVYLDGVYISRIQGALFKLYDIERVEVLRGPQGTLYGKNTIGGAIKLISRKPGNEVEGMVEATYGKYDRIDAKGYLAAPLIEDKLAVSLSALTNDRDGFVKDPVTGNDYNDDNTDVFRSIVRATPSENLELTFSADYTRQRTALTLGNPEAALTQVDFGLGAVILRPAPAPGSKYNYETRTAFTNGEGQELDHWGTSVTADWSVNENWSFTSITAYRNLKTDFFMDIDASELVLGDISVDLDQWQFSQELQLKYTSDRLNAIFGAYYMREENTTYQEAYADDFLAFFGAPISLTRTVGDNLDTKSYAAFMQMTYRATDQFSITAGLRYSKDKKDYFRTTSTFSNLPLLVGTFAFTDEDSWDAWTPSLTLDYRWSEDVMTYASMARGFKSGGFNGRANSAVEVSSFKPELVWSYEAGVKSRLADRRLRLNAAAFYNDYTDFQARVSEVVNPNDPVPTFSFPVLNAGKMETYGFEVEMIAAVAEGLNLYGALGYLEANYKEFTDAIRGDRSDDHPPFAPKWTLRLGADYTLDLGNSGRVTLSGDTSYKAKHWLSVDNRDVLTQDGYWVFNAGLRYEPEAGGWYLAAAAKNIGDKLYKTDAQEFSSVGNIQTAYYGDPFTWSVTAGYKF